MEYEELDPISRELASEELACGDEVRVSRALVRLALFDTDRLWLEELLTQFLGDPRPQVRGVAATCVGHVARIHRRINLEVLKKLQGLLDDQEMGGRVGDALDDIKMFVKDS